MLVVTIGVVVIIGYVVVGTIGDGNLSSQRVLTKFIIFLLVKSFAGFLFVGANNNVVFSVETNGIDGTVNVDVVYKASPFVNLKLVIKPPKPLTILSVLPIIKSDVGDLVVL